MNDVPKPMNLRPEEAARLLALPARPVRKSRLGLSRETRNILKPFAKRFGPGVGELQLAWTQIVGDRLGKLSAPQKLSGGDAGQTLWIEAAGPVALALEAQGAQLLDRISRFAGSGRINRIRCVKPRPKAVGSTPPVPRTTRRGIAPEELAALEAQLAHLPEGDLKKALRELGRGVMMRDHQG